MKKLATTVFGIFLAATSFANVTPAQDTQIKNQEIVVTVQNTSKTSTLINQINKVMALKATAAKGGPRLVIQTCVTRCEDSL
ncbi:MAG: hypothetical protein L3J45_01955 [Flavobacteriaceae bacterium]|nr:hypothetical protein [Flavobacteriaceae bacterium]